MKANVSVVRPNGVHSTRTLLQFYEIAVVVIAHPLNNPITQSIDMPVVIIVCPLDELIQQFSRLAGRILCLCNRQTYTVQLLFFRLTISDGSRLKILHSIAEFQTSHTIQN